jgi:2-oxoglutarate ferredoxin oxidoreductase subunit gamma
MSKTKHQEMVLAGSGGQGLILSGVLLAEAAIFEGKNVVQTQSYGIASRGGLSLAEVIIDEEEIIFQQVQTPNCILALTEEAVRKYEAWTESGVPIYYDITIASPRKGRNYYGHPFTQLASDLGNVASVNILALGTIAAGTGVVKLESLEHMIRKRFKGAAAELNLKMLAAGRGIIAGGDEATRSGSISDAMPLTNLDTQPGHEDFGRVPAAETGRKRRRTGVSRKKFEVEVNPAVCKGCGYCMEVCKPGVFDLSDQFNPRGYQPSVAARSGQCTGCLRCLNICPDFCITIDESAERADR